MEKLAVYRNHITELIKSHSHPSAYGEIELQHIFDTVNDHYQLVYTGWNKKQRQYGCIIHIDIKNGKIWIQHDGTETGIADELADMGVPREDIVLAYHHPYKRQYSGFATS